MKNRFIDLFNKLVSIKGIFAITATVNYALNQGQEYAFWAFIGAWGVLIGWREVYKIVELLKK